MTRPLIKRKITEDDVKVMKYIYNQWNLSISRIAESLGISREYASRLIHDKSKIKSSTKENLKKDLNEVTTFPEYDYQDTDKFLIPDITEF